MDTKKDDDWKMDPKYVLPLPTGQHAISKAMKDRPYLDITEKPFQFEQATPNLVLFQSVHMDLAHLFFPVGICLMGLLSTYHRVVVCACYT